MKVIEHLANASRPLVSVEILPPRRGRNVQRIYDAVDSLMPYEPPFIDITSHAAETVWEETPDGTWKRRTQLFYDNEAYFSFVKAARNQGVTIPIVPGLKLLTRRSHLTSIPRTFNVSVPEALVAEVAAVPDERIPDIGIEWARQQTLQLFEQGVPSAHFYVMQDTGPLVRLLEQLKPEL